MIKPVHVGRNSAWCFCINPQHKETHPSMEITLSGEFEGRCYCHGCGRVYQLNKSEVEKLKAMCTVEEEMGPMLNLEELYFHNLVDVRTYPKKSQPYNQKLYEAWSVSPFTLEDIGIFWKENKYWIPMWDAPGSICGVQYQYMDGFKINAAGSKLGIFCGTLRFEPFEPVFMTEGCSDFACLYDMGFQGFGRPSCNGAIDIIIKTLEDRTTTTNKLIVIADNDSPGIEGANKLCNAWNERNETKQKMTVWIPECKDLREEVKAKGKDIVREILGGL